MTDLSAQAQAVIDAWEAEWTKGKLCHEQRSIAAALLVATQSIPIPSLHEEDAFHAGWWVAMNRIRTIAYELAELS